MFVYVLESQVDYSQYVGISDRPQERLIEHNRGEVRSTHDGRPWKHIWLEEVPNRVEARKREKYLKSAAGRRFRKQLPSASRTISSAG